MSRSSLLFFLLISMPLSALEPPEEQLVPDPVETSTPERQGWVPELRIGSTFSFSHSSDVAGAQDGQTWNIGPTLDGSMAYYDGEHEWRSSLSFRYVLTRTPVVEEFVKTVDTLLFDSIYLYRVPGASWFGPFAHLALTTSVSTGEDVRAQPVTYRTLETDGSVGEQQASRLTLTQPFSPLVLNEAVGVFARPFDLPELRLELRLGAGAREVFVQNGIAVQDDSDTEAIEAKRLQDYQQFGAEFFLGAKGTLQFETIGRDRPLTYALSTSVMMPLYSSLTENRGIGDLTNVTLEAGIGVRLFAWMSLDYSFRMVRQPLIVDAFQLQNNLLLSFSLAIVESTLAEADAEEATTSAP